MASFPLTHIQKEIAEFIKKDINDMLTFMIRFINFKNLSISEDFFKKLLKTTLKPILTMPTSTDTKTHVQEFIEKLKKNSFSTADNLPAYIYLFNVILIALIAADKPHRFLGITTHEWQSQVAEISPEIYQYFAAEGYLHQADIFSLMRKLKTEIGFYFSGRGPLPSPSSSVEASTAPVPSPIHSSPSTASSSGRSTPTGYGYGYVNDYGLVCFDI
jgi:hypothetical protein